MGINFHSNQYQPHLLLTENVKGRDFVVSDLHGYRSQLDSILRDLRFSYAHDRLISVGDLIDRGPESEDCLALLDEPWFWAVRGNHEQMLIDAVQQGTELPWSRWLMNGGTWTLKHSKAQLSDWAKCLNSLPMTITLPYHQAKIGICHAEYTATDWDHRSQLTDSQAMEWLWGRTRLHRSNTTRIDGIDWVFSGHTIVSNVKLLGNSVFIERGAYLNNNLTLIDLHQWVNDHR